MGIGIYVQSEQQIIENRDEFLLVLKKKDKVDEDENENLGAWARGKHLREKRSIGWRRAEAFEVGEGLRFHWYKGETMIRSFSPCFDFLWWSAKEWVKSVEALSAECRVQSAECRGLVI